MLQTKILIYKLNLMKPNFCDSQKQQLPTSELFLGGFQLLLS